MNERVGNSAVAALDIGTSQIKLGVFYPLDSPRITLLGSIKNEINCGTDGNVTSSYEFTRETSFSLFQKLGRFFMGRQPERLYVGLSSHVSSLLR
ncbi:MAG: hypothetical protein AMS26_12400, partial [Bacteroides sp. SM23_62]